ncbi:MAG: hypothetical protein H6853_04930 [Rhodospirillales bacterium]|nr:hypothetical protein [Alphaproteobacteria bacterium]USO02897.1 MAG: hypothetical protein H6853_04930 [Rhodospirillales bacterium]
MLKRWALGLGQKLFGGFLGAADKTAAEAAQKALQAGILKKGVDAATAASAMGGLGKSSFLGKALKVTGLGAAAEVLLNGGLKSYVGGALNEVYTWLGLAEAEQNTAGAWHSFFKNLQELLGLFGIESKWLNDKIATHAKKDSKFENFKDTFSDDLSHVGHDLSDNALGYGIGAAGIAAGYGVGKTALLKYATNPAGTGFLRNAVATVGNKLSAIPGIGKKLAILSGVAAGAYSLWPSSAEASEAGSIVTDPVSTELGNEITSSEIATEVGAAGVSILGTTTAVSAASPAAAMFGLKGVPGLGAVIAAGDALYDTAKYALHGDFTKAGLRLVAGAGETVAGVGGVLTYGTLGTAWREAVNAGGKALFGEENDIGHSYVVQGGSFIANIFSDAADPAPEVAQNRAPVRKLEQSYVPA